MTNVNTTLNSRQSTHGDFRDNGRIMQRLKFLMRTDGVNWQAGKLEEFQQEALDMIQHKIGRILSGNPSEPDHWLDICGYAQLVYNILTTGKSHTSQDPQ